MKLVRADRVPENSRVKLGVTFQWEMLDCFLSPHDCTSEQVADGVKSFLDAAVEEKIPVEITLDPIQFYFASNLWNWFDPDLPGYNKDNIRNVEWTNFSNSSATQIAWRNWGAQFRMPTPQPNLASPKLLNVTCEALAIAIQSIREWWEKSTEDGRSLLVGLKLCEEADVGANYYYYKNGNTLRNGTSRSDPTHGPDWSLGLFGGLPALGYNMLQTLGIRSSGGPPTRKEITAGVRHYFKSIIDACVQAWPALQTNGLLVAHAGHVSDPLLIEWSAPMVQPAIPGYSFYFGPKDFPKVGMRSPVGQQGLKDALATYYNASEDWGKREYVAAECACFGCSSINEWKSFFDVVFRKSMNPYGRVKYLRYYNIEPFASLPGAVEGLHQFLANFDE